MIFLRIICLVIGYAFGLIQSAYIYGKTKGVDIRDLGSGNAGMTNTLRNFGKKAGIIVFLVDFLKCLLAMLLVRFIFGGSNPTSVRLLMEYAGAGAILGHCFPFYMGFRGGKGISCLAGIIVGTSLPLTLIAAVVFFTAVLLTHYVSLGSILLSVLYFAGVVVLTLNGTFRLSYSLRPEMILLAAFITFLTIFLHRSNISRLLAGTERKTYFFGKPDKK